VQTECQCKLGGQWCSDGYHCSTVVLYCSVIIFRYHFGRYHF